MTSLHNHNRFIVSTPLIHYMRALSLLLVCVVLLQNLTVAEANSPSDVSMSHPNYNAINSLLNSGVIQGYPDGTIKPNQPINRVEALKLVMRSNNMTPYWYITHLYYADIERGSWYEPYVAAATDSGLVQGYNDGHFRPKQYVTSPELLTMLLRSKNIHIDSTSTTAAPYQDVATNAWYAPMMAYAKNRNILPNIPQIFPTKALSRGEASEIIYRFIQAESNSMSTNTENNSSINQDTSSNIYELPADTHIIPPTFGETEARENALETNTPLPAMYQQPTVVQNSPTSTSTTTNTNEINWWPVYNVTERLQNNIDTDPFHQIFGPVQFMNAWNFAQNVSQEATRYSQDHLNYEYQYTDITKPGSYIWNP